MLFQKLALFSAIAALAAAQDINPSDIPQQCTAICAEVVSVARRCDNENDSDAAELSCICRAPNANTLVPTCEACVRQFDRDDDDNDDDNDVHEVLTRCNFTTTTYNTASASSILQSAASSFASASGTVVVMTSGTVVLTTSIPASVPTTTQLPQQTGGAGSSQGAGAALGVGVMGVVLGML